MNTYRLTLKVHLLQMGYNNPLFESKPPNLASFSGVYGESEETMAQDLKINSVAEENRWSHKRSA